uniref:PDZ domain-containing protein n=1 Tax=Parastrongyloides trichosuri TaxID=131310 RepID=A0A0N4ZMW7_PARTI
MTELRTVNMSTTGSQGYEDIVTDEIHNHERSNEISNVSSDTSPSKLSQISTNSSDNSQVVSQILLSSLQTTSTIIPQPNISDLGPEKFQEVMSTYMQSIMSAAANRFQQDPSAAAAFLAQQSALLQTTNSLTSLSSPSKISTNNSIESMSMSSSPIPTNDAHKNLETLDVDEDSSTMQEMSQEVIVSNEIDKLTISSIEDPIIINNENSRVNDTILVEEDETNKNNHCNNKDILDDKKLNNKHPISGVVGNIKKINDPHTSELIKKQMNEIEKEIIRKSQNKNIRKAALPFSAVSNSIVPSTIETKPSLKSLQTSFSPPPNTIQPEQNNVFSGVTFYTGQGMSFHPQDTSNIVPSTSYDHHPGTISFVSPQHNKIPTQGTSNNNISYSPSMPHFNNSPQQQPATIPNSTSTSSISRFNPFLPSPETSTINQQTVLPNNNQQQQNMTIHEKSQEFYNPLSGSTSSLPSAAPPQLSNITPELAAAILSQLQQNPSLLENIATSTSNSAASSAASILLQATTSKMSPESSYRGSTNNGDIQLTKLPPPPAAGSKVQSLRNNLIAPSNNTTGKQLINKKSNGINDDKENSTDNDGGVWVMRGGNDNNDQQSSNGYIQQDSDSGTYASIADDNIIEEEEVETDKLLAKTNNVSSDIHNNHHKNNYQGHHGTTNNNKKSSSNKKEVLIHEPAVLIEGVLFRAKYLGSTQLVCDGRPSKSSRMSQAQEAVARVKAPEGEIQPSTEIDLFISTEKIMVLNTDLQRISDTDVRQDILMDHALRTISYIADIGDLVVLMARRMSNSPSLEDGDTLDTIKKTPKVVCHVFESDEAAFIAQSIGQAFQVAYVEFLRANGIEDPTYLREIDYQEVLNSQELLGEELEMFARKETQKDVIIPKKVGEALGIVVVESGWGSMLPTVVVANLAPGGAASRSNQLNIGDQIIAINGISLVGLPLASAQQNIRNAKTSTVVRLTVVSTPPVVEVRIKRPDTKYQLGFSVQNGVICSLLRGGIAERGGIRVGHRIIEINHQSVVAVAHEKIVNILATATGEIHMKTMPTSMFRLLTGQEIPNYI